jgi:hypothetical protein
MVACQYALRLATLVGFDQSNGALWGDVPHSRRVEDVWVAVFDAPQVAVGRGFNHGSIVEPYIRNRLKSITAPYLSGLDLPAVLPHAYVLVVILS